MVAPDFLGLSRVRRRELVAYKIRRALGSCRGDEDCRVRLVKVLAELLEGDSSEGVETLVAALNELPERYRDLVPKLVSLVRGSYDSPHRSEVGFSIEREVGRFLAGELTCSDLDSVPHIVSESRDFLSAALAIALLERSAELRSCSHRLARVLLSLVRKLYESGKRELASTILASYGVRVYVYKTGDSIRGVKVSLGSGTEVDLSDAISLVYSDISYLIKTSSEVVTRTN
jgi:hypothetical protein